MALIDPQPPTIFPRGRYRRRPPSPGSFSPSRSQSWLDLNRAGNANGMRISGATSGGPASSTSTLTSGSSLSRPASTHPAEPPPTIT